MPRVQRDWFTDDERRSLFGTLSRGSSVRRNPSLLQRSLSLVSNSTAVPDFGKIDFSVDNLCKYINAHPSLQRAEIVATECYVGKGLVKHRFLVLELRRQGRKDMFLRLDRRRERGVSMTQFISLSGTTGANDLVRQDPCIVEKVLAEIGSFRLSWLQTNRCSLKIINSRTGRRIQHYLPSVL